MQRATRSLIHFLLLGFGLFAGDRVLGAWLAKPPPEVIDIDTSRIGEVRREWIMQTRSLPTPYELERLIEAEIDDEILFREAVGLGFVETDPVVRRRLVQNVRFLGSEQSDEQALFDEALSLGLERTDPVVRRRLVQRMRMGIEGAARRELPSDEELRAHYQANAERYVAAARVRLSHVYIARSPGGPDPEARARKLRARISAEQPDVQEAVRWGSPFLRGHDMPLRSQRELMGIFGPNLAERVFGLDVGAWSGPIESAYGFHLVWIHDHQPERQRELAEVESKVREEILSERASAALRRALDRLRDYYVIRVDSLDEGSL